MFDRRFRVYLQVVPDGSLADFSTWIERERRLYTIHVRRTHTNWTEKDHNAFDVWLTMKYLT